METFDGFCLGYMGGATKIPKHCGTPLHASHERLSLGKSIKRSWNWAQRCARSNHPAVLFVRCRLSALRSKLVCRTKSLLSKSVRPPCTCICLRLFKREMTATL